jgi:hypothetical protein
MMNDDELFKNPSEEAGGANIDLAGKQQTAAGWTTGCGSYVSST